MRGWTFLAGFVAVALAYPFVSLHHPGSADEGLVVMGGIDVWHGRVPYRDFQLYHTPGCMLLAGAAFALFGPHLWVVQSLTLMTAFGLSAATVLVAGHLVPPRGALAAGLVVALCCLPAYPILIYHWVAGVFLLLGFHAVLLESKPWLIAAGVAVGFSALCLQSEGAAGLLALSAVLVFLKTEQEEPVWARLLFFWGGILLVWLPFLSALGLLGALHPFLEQAVFRAVGRIHHLHGYPYNFQVFAVEPWSHLGSWREFGAVLGQTVRYATLLPVLLLAVGAGWKKGGKDAAFALLVVAWFLLKKERLDATYANFLTPLWAISIVWLLWLGLQRARKPALALAGGLGVLFLLQFGSLVATASGPRYWLQTPAGRVWLVSKDRRQELQAFYDLARRLTPPGSVTFIGPFHPQFYFLSQTRNATRFAHLVAGWHDGAQVAAAKVELRAGEVEYVYYRPLSEPFVSGVPLLDPERFRADLQEQRDQLLSDYRLKDEVGGVAVYQVRSRAR